MEDIEIYGAGCSLQKINFGRIFTFLLNLLSQKRGLSLLDRHYIILFLVWGLFAGFSDSSVTEEVVREGSLFQGYY